MEAQNTVDTTPTSRTFKSTPRHRADPPVCTLVPVELVISSAWLFKIVGHNNNELESARSRCSPQPLVEKAPEGELDVGEKPGTAIC